MSHIYNERVNKREAEFVMTLGINEFFKLFPRNADSDDNGVEMIYVEDKQYFNAVQEYLLDHLLNSFKGEDVEYKTSKIRDNGRIFANSTHISLQRIHRSLRHFLTHNLYTDFDINSCHFRILREICKKNDLPTLHQDNYINNREKILEKHNLTKKQLLKWLNQDDVNGQLTYGLDGIPELIDELQYVKKILNKKYKKKYPPKDKSKNPISSTINAVLCDEEHKLLMKIQEKYNCIAVPMFDGFLTLSSDSAFRKSQPKGGKGAEAPSFTISDLDELTGVKWEIKPIVSNIEVPKDFVFPYKSYQSYKEKFEEIHFKCIDPPSFCKINEEGKLSTYTKDGIKIAYEHIKCLKRPNCGFGVANVKFIEKWFEDENIRIYESIGSFPNNDGPENVYNCWTEFRFKKLMRENDWKMETIDGVWGEIPPNMDMKTYKKHVDKFDKHLCYCTGEEDEFKASYELPKGAKFLLWFIAQLVQFPNIKSICPTFMADEGSGKSCLAYDLMKALLGDEKVFATSDPLNNVFGKFNQLMATAYLVILNETQKYDVMKVQGKIKECITDPYIVINGKNVPSWRQRSNHRFWNLTNNLNGGMVTRKGDRRNMMYNCSEALKGKKAYFDDWFENMVENDEAVMCIGHYLMNVDCPKKILESHFPTMEYQELLKESNTDFMDRWLKKYAYENDNDGSVKTRDLYGSFRDWLSINFISNYDVSYPSFYTKLGLRKFKGIKAAGKDENKMSLKYINFKQLKENFEYDENFGF